MSDLFAESEGIKEAEHGDVAVNQHTSDMWYSPIQLTHEGVEKASNFSKKELFTGLKSFTRPVFQAKINLFGGVKF